MRDLDEPTEYTCIWGGRFVVRTVAPEEDGSYTARIRVFGSLDEGEQRFVAQRSSRKDAIFAATAKWKMALTKEKEPQSKELDYGTVPVSEPV